MRSIHACCHVLAVNARYAVPLGLSYGYENQEELKHLAEISAEKIQ
jgi:hypothetical protein